MRTAVEDIAFALIGEQTRTVHTIDGGHQDRRAIGHCRIDHLTTSRLLRFEQAGQHADREQHAAATKVADQVERRRWRTIGVADRITGTGQGDVVDVVAGDLGQRPILAPAGNAAIDQLGIALPAVLGAEAQSLGDASAETFDQGVGAGHHAQDQFDTFGLLQIDRDRAATAIEQRVLRLHRDAEIGIDHTIDAYHLGAHVGEHHRAHRVGANARQFNHLVSDQWSTRGHFASPSIDSLWCSPRSADRLPHYASSACSCAVRQARIQTRGSARYSCARAPRLSAGDDRRHSPSDASREKDVGPGVHDRGTKRPTAHRRRNHRYAPRTPRHRPARPVN